GRDEKESARLRIHRGCQGAPVIFIEGETPQLPQYMHEAELCEGGRRIGCTQPMRVAALSEAARVAVGSAPRLDPPWRTRFDWRIEKRRVRRRRSSISLLECC
ncbi:hypothetical protein PENTCL1PPCAC_9154, partial [Pristionchus entomophagus]